MKPEELADELEAAALEMETGEDTKPSFIATLRKSAAALRQVEVMRGALKQIAASCGPHDCEAAYWRCDAARQALTGEA